MVIQGYLYAKWRKAFKKGRRKVLFSWRNVEKFNIMCCAILSKIGIFVRPQSSILEILFSLC